MRDIHCHILPGVDDGSRDLQESLDMLQAAKGVGITQIVATPHCREPHYDYDAMRAAYEALKPHAEAAGLELEFGFEVNYRMLEKLGMEWARKLTLAGGDDILYELSARSGAPEFAEHERTIQYLQSLGLKIVVAHPERYLAIQQDVDVAYRLAEAGCKLQLSATSFALRMWDPIRRTAAKLCKEGLYDCMASDAHCVDDYRWFQKAAEKLGFGE